MCLCVGDFRPQTPFEFGESQEPLPLQPLRGLRLLWQQKKQHAQPYIEILTPFELKCV